MTAKEKFGYWKSYAERDLDAAEAMFETGRWFYVLFMCQQAVEKLVKGLYTIHVGEEPPKIHNIEHLADRIEDCSSISFDKEVRDLLRTLTKYYIADRYPDFISKTGEQASKGEASDVLHRTREVFEWLLTLSLLEN